jgi:succinylarginine dihydrolase
MVSDEYKDWNITLTFSVPPMDTDGVLTEAIFDAAVDHAPSEAKGITARADTEEGKVWITFTLVDTSGALARSISTEMRERVHETVFTSEDACITAS